MNPLKKLTALGQSIWLDYIKRDLITSGELKKMITEDDLRGMTSNPSLFEKAIADSDEYNKDIENLSQSGKSVSQIYDILTQKDVQSAADEFYPLYDQLDGKDGYVSLEVNPHLAHDTEGTVKEARRLWKALDRPNVFIKVPATKEGVPAIKQLISEGINVNVTLLFGLTRYQDVAEAYIAGIETRLAQGKPVKQIASVASFFLSRIDTLIDPLLENKTIEQAEMSTFVGSLQGQVAIASAKIAYQMFNEIFTSKRFKKLAQQGARVQRLLWASTSTKNPAYSDVKYIESLIGPDTVNTVPLETLNAYRDHGNPEIRLNSDFTKAHFVLQELTEMGIDLDKITQQLENEGIDKFNQAYNQLIATLNKTIKRS